MSNYTTLREANIARNVEWSRGKKLSSSFRGNELAGEVGEALEEAVTLLLLSVSVGRLSNIIKKLDREAMGLPGSRADAAALATELADVIICADLIGMDHHIDLEKAVREKFNAMSEKVGLETRMIAP